MHGELNYAGAKYHAWHPLTADNNQWYQFTFKDIVSVAEILTRGCGDYDNWSKSFKLQASNDCNNWTWAESES